MIKSLSIGVLVFTFSHCVSSQDNLEELLELPATTKNPVETGVTVLEEGVMREARKHGIARGREERIKELNRELDSVANEFDKIFSFQNYLIESSSGALIIPPIVTEYGSSKAVNGQGDILEQRALEYRVVAPAKLTLSPPTWREYLYMASYPPMQIEPSVLDLARKNEAVWRKGAIEGWEAGRELAEREFDGKKKQLRRIWLGLINYHLLVEKGMINALFVAEDQSEIIGDDTTLTIGRKIIQITRPMTFNFDADDWQPVLVR